MLCGFTCYSKWYWSSFYKSYCQHVEMQLLFVYWLWIPPPYWTHLLVLVILCRLFRTMYTTCCLWTKMLFSSFFNLCAFYFFTFYFFFYAFYLLLEVGPLIQCQVEIARADISALFPILWASFSDFISRIMPF